MLSLSELVQIYFCTQPTDMRKSFDSLAALVRDWLGYDRSPATCLCSVAAEGIG